MAENSQFSILVIDDDELTRTLIVETLKREGYTLLAAENGCYALEQLQSLSPDLIISDIMMPELDGLSLLTQLRGSPATRGIPVILVTAQGQIDQLVSAFRMGADDFVVKPFNLQELCARVQAKLDRPPVPKDMLTFDPQTGVLSEKNFNQEVQREMNRVSRGGTPGCLAYIQLAGWQQVLNRFGPQGEMQVLRQLSQMATVQLGSLDLIGRLSAGRVALLFPESAAGPSQEKLEAISTTIVSSAFKIGEETLSLTPAVGFSEFTRQISLDEAFDQALTALDQSVRHLDLHPRQYTPSMGSLRSTQTDRKQKGQNFMSWAALPGEIVLTYVIGWLLPFLVYLVLDELHFDISREVYLIVVAALVLTGIFIWVEGFLSLKHIDPPAEPGSPYPPASAIIAAYLPNEAATILDTVDAFLQIDYPGPLQILLAYNTPGDLPIEKTLLLRSQSDPRLELLKVEGSTSKAQNVNAALERVTGKFTGIFDADHQPEPQCFQRAWRWLSNGVDVVQGHCLVRNGSATLISRLVAVEFEVIYGSSHPGRTRWHQFGIFGGSNGYWKTELLRQTRMRGYMLTEDIDSSMRALEMGAKIVSDPRLYSRELAPVNLFALWHQRMRWAQGWFQVSIQHFWRGLFSKNFSARQKLGLFWLLGWREIYPWISMQVIPLIAFWAVKYHGLSQLDWLIPVFVLATLFTLSVGPGQTLFGYLVAAPEIRQHKRWFCGYLFASSLFYTEFKNLIGRVAQMKEYFNEQQWKVTPRSSEPADEANE